MNRWTLQAEQHRAALERARRRILPRGMAGDFVTDWDSPIGRGSPPATPPPGPIEGLGRNLSAEEATATAILRDIVPPAGIAAAAVNARGLGNGGSSRAGAGGGNSALTPTGQIEVVDRPWLMMPAAGQGFMQPNIAAVVLGAIGTTTVVVTFTVPRRKNGSIEWISNQFVGGGWTEGNGALIWRVLADGIPVQGFDFIISSIGSMSNPADLRMSPIRIYENQVITLVVQNVAVVAAGQFLLGQLRGKLFPIEQEGQSTWL
jgi:hypothetical protein